VQWAGSRSYAIYLWHYPLIGLCVNLDYRGTIQMGLALVLTLLAAELSYHLIESPFQRISKRRFGERAIGMAARI
jgi:peptidoglycan/LPS O-acetylase OafA/YrhL